MTNKDSKTKHINFINRLDFFILLVYSGLLIPTGIIGYITGHEILTYSHVKSSTYIPFFISCFFFFLAIYTILRTYREAIVFINEVRINNKTITLIGYRYDTKWEETLDIKNTDISLKEQKRGRAPYVYYLEFSDEYNEKHNINTSIYWSYIEILNLYNDIKSLKEKK